MEISVSDLCFCGFKYQGLLQLNKAYGIEFFYEFGKDSYWNTVLPQIQKGRQLPPSVHGPCLSVNLASPEDKQYLRIWRKTIAYAHQINAEFVVVHTNEGWKGSKAKVQQLVFKRLKTLLALAKEQGVTLAIENVGLKPKGNLLFEEEEYLQLLKLLKAKALLDIGHAQVNGWDILLMINRLGSSLVAVHIHDNDGLQDSHQCLGEGCVAWAPIMAALKAHAPKARLVLEYADAQLKDIEASLELIKKL